jgi:hypothetical protein
VRIRGSLFGIDFKTVANTPLECDCRFVMALSRVVPRLEAHGVEALWYSGAYVFRRTKKGRLSLHARGLALDVHAVTIRGKQLWVKKDYASAGARCSKSESPLKDLACDLSTLSLFKELITPDHDSDHHDHIHLGIAPPEYYEP